MKKMRLNTKKKMSMLKTFNTIRESQTEKKTNHRYW